MRKYTYTDYAGSQSRSRWPDAYEHWANRQGCPFKRNSTELTGPCPHCGGDDRFSIHFKGAKRGVFHCRQCVPSKNQAAYESILRGLGVWKEHRAGSQRFTSGPRGKTRRKARQAGADAGAKAKAGGGGFKPNGAEYRYPYSATQHVVRRNGTRSGKPDKKFHLEHIPRNGVHFVKGAGPDPWPLFRLDLAKDEDFIVLVEGEKAAKACLPKRHHGATWRGGTGGVNAAIKAGAFASLKDRYVILVPDNDAAGRAAMAKIADHLEGVAAQVVVLNPWTEDDPPKRDFADITAERRAKIIDRCIGEVPLEDVKGWHTTSSQAKREAPAADAAAWLYEEYRFGLPGEVHMATLWVAPRKEQDLRWCADKGSATGGYWLAFDPESCVWFADSKDGAAVRAAVSRNVMAYVATLTAKVARIKDEAEAATEALKAAQEDGADHATVADLEKEADRLAATAERCRKAVLATLKAAQKQQYRSTIAVDLRDVPELIVRPDQLDTDAHLIAFRDGVWNQRTGKRLPNAEARERMITKMVPFEVDQAYLAAPDSEEQQERIKPWLLLKKHIADHLEGTIRRLNRFLGYWSTGSMREQRVLWLTGRGNNGKSLFLDTVRYALGDEPSGHATKLALNTFAASNRLDPQRRLFPLKGKRFATLDEPNRGKFAKEMWKDAVSSDQAWVEEKWQAQHRISLRAKMLIASNKPPRLEDDPAFRRRLDAIAVPQVRARDTDTGLIEALKARAALIATDIALVQARKYWDAGNLGVITEPMLEAADTLFKDADPKTAAIREVIDVHRTEDGKFDGSDGKRATAAAIAAAAIAWAEVHAEPLEPSNWKAKTPEAMKASLEREMRQKAGYYVMSLEGFDKTCRGLWKEGGTRYTGYYGITLKERA